MSKKKKNTPKSTPKKQQQSVFQEAWGNMNSDFDKILPEKFRNKGKKKFVLWLFILEVVVLSGVGLLVWKWISG